MINISKSYVTSYISCDLNLVQQTLVSFPAKLDHVCQIWYQIWNQHQFYFYLKLVV